MKEINTLREQNAEILTVKSDGFKLLITKELGVVVLTVTRIFDP
jgi:hypothetical protein